MNDEEIPIRILIPGEDDKPANMTPDTAVNIPMIEEPPSGARKSKGEKGSPWRCRQSGRSASCLGRPKSLGY